MWDAVRRRRIVQQLPPSVARTFSDAAAGRVGSASENGDTSPCAVPTGPAAAEEAVVVQNEDEEASSEAERGRGKQRVGRRLRGFFLA